MGKWTKGPWTKSKVNPKLVNGNNDYYEVLWSQDGELISDGVYGKENASLISAAPDMAEVLETAIELYGKEGGPWNVPGSDGSWIEKAKAALSKAKGE